MADVPEDVLIKAGGEALRLIRDDNQVLTITYRHDLGWSYSFCSQKTWKRYKDGWQSRFPPEYPRSLGDSDGR